MNWFILLLVISNLSSADPSGDELTWSADRPLSWEDFRTRTGRPEFFKAFSYTGMRYTVDAPDGKQVNIEVEAYFVHSKSWVHHDHKRESLLRHEQGHFNLTAIYAHQLDSLLQPYEVGIEEFMDNKMIGRVEVIFDSLYASLQDEQDRYDRETGHSTLVKEQDYWENYIEARMALLGQD